MNTIFKTAALIVLLATGFALNAQNTVIIQKNDTIIVKIDGEEKVTIISPEVSGIIEEIQKDISEEQGDSIVKTISVEITDDDTVVVQQEKQVRVITIMNDDEADNEMHPNGCCGNKPDCDDDVFEPFLNIDWGMNNYLNNGRFPDSYNAQYTVKPWGSWSFSIGPGLRIHAGDYLSLNLSADVTWYNFKFQDKSTRIEKTDDGLEFGRDAGIQFPLRSKLTVAYVGAQIIPMVHFGKDDDDFNRKMFRFGAGAYAGYRIDSYAKYVDEDMGRKTKLRYHDNYYLENFRYGVKAIFGVKDLNIFASYDLNNLFSPNKAPKLNAFSIGLNFTI